MPFFMVLLQLLLAMSAYNGFDYSGADAFFTRLDKLGIIGAGSKIKNLTKPGLLLNLTGGDSHLCVVLIVG
jgi:hypothetical protein